ncbi:MAG: DUF2191 domain-containing protein [Acidobacteria bacterium]|nr:DUF2191 domain-containing protein [Acidobacteriota bacterium]
MRTTLTLDDDVSALLARFRRGRKAGLKQVVNEALRQGLRQMTAPPAPRRPYRTRPVSLGRCLIGSLDDVSETLAIAEGENFR